MDDVDTKRHFRPVSASSKGLGSFDRSRKDDSLARVTGLYTAKLMPAQTFAEVIG
jgi:hypothetical protein